ncbi:unnamed protein product [Penicillium roqueforti FM164]|uniref:Uncharacterized protein n=1 Tax=Penicillium roqueforti (strain FM164) TaxID=1365484 RepID=W6R5Q3_PENRF|nr:unnamed protein product [Penicillium roqueforti FM164]
MFTSPYRNIEKSVGGTYHSTMLDYSASMADDMTTSIEIQIEQD